MLQATSPFIAQACTAMAQGATSAVQAGAQSFAAMLEALKPAEKQTPEAEKLSGVELGKQLQSRLETLQNLLRKYLSASSTEITSPLTLQVEGPGKMEVYGDAAAADELKHLFAQHSDLRAALEQLTSAYEKQAAAATLQDPHHTGGLSATSSPLRLFVRGDSVELLTP